MTMRKGLGKGMGMGYKNLAPKDSYVHSMSRRGVKTYGDFTSGKTFKNRNDALKFVKKLQQKPVENAKSLEDEGKWLNAKGKKSPLSAREIIRKEYGSSKNFMTPHVISVGKINPNTAYELSSGEGFERGTTIYGVSIVRYDPETGETRRSNLSTSFQSKAEAETYIGNLYNLSDLMLDQMEMR